MNDVLWLLLAAGLTVVIEVPFLSFAFRFRGREILVSIFLNLGTNFVLNGVLSLFEYPAIWIYVLALLGGEAIVFFVEGLVYSLMRQNKRGFLASISANSISLILGSLLLWWIQSLV